MQCPNCGNVLSQGDLFCGQCGFDLGNAHTLISQKHAQGFYTAPTIASFDVQSAATSLQNPYHSLIVGLNMPQIYHNGDTEAFWSGRYRVKLEEVKSVSHREYTGNGTIIVYGNTFETRKGWLRNNNDWLMPYEFTFQTLVAFTQDDLTEWSPGYGHISNLVFNVGDDNWELYPQYKGSPNNVVLKDHTGGVWRLQVPSYAPFLFGLVRFANYYYVFVNGIQICKQPFIKPYNTTMRLGFYKGPISLSHPKIWKP